MAETVANVVERSTQTPLATAVASIMVHVDFDAGSDNRINIAADWARKFDAVLIGVAGWLPGREVGGWFAAELERPKDRLDRISVELNRLGDHFRNLAGRTVHAVEWRGTFHFPREVIATEARAADLVVIGSHSVAEDVYHAFDPGMVLLSAGRPVLVVPDGVTSNAGQRVVVAWKDTREARHAVQSALPYLKITSHVALVAIAEEVLETATHHQLDDVANYLLRHGIKVDVKAVLHPKGSVLDQLMSMAESERADLIVSGAYGHTRLGEWVFGGVTRGLLGRGEVCCLFCN
jgi:nucleotide-binding universal stress UspA family protein